jgi:hypothetical protein
MPFFFTFLFVGNFSRANFIGAETGTAYFTTNPSTIHTGPILALERRGDDEETNSEETIGWR